MRRRKLTENEINVILRSLLVLVDRSEPTQSSHGDISAARAASDLEALIRRTVRTGASGEGLGEWLDIQIHSHTPELPPDAPHLAQLERHIEVAQRKDDGAQDVSVYGRRRHRHGRPDGL